MKRVYFSGFLVLLLFLAGCAGRVYKTEGGYRQGHKFFSTEEAKKQAAAGKGEVMNLVCSYYGTKFHGRKTSNGETFDMFKMTCAHKEMEFGTMLKVTNPDNGKSVTVKVNDRGPFVENRDIDLSYGAAKELGMLHDGVKKMQVEILSKP
ncbi:MAG: septal ring lytic transglycosylase RlpA family protein [Candidatus Cloacimonetes bacterium]|nr:septal ring lytic transglycosylase RlpA family protein [Candidatus Cloacimonadota bacterium]